MKLSRRIIAATMAAAMALCLSACKKENVEEVTTTLPVNEVVTTVPQETTAQTITTEVLTTETPTTATPTTATPTTEATTAAPVTAAPTAAPTQPVTQAAVGFAANKDKKGDIFKAEGQSKVWAGIVGDAYILFRNIDTPNEWEISGRVYELHVAQFAGKYGMWSDGTWEINDAGTELKLTPAHQSENGNIGIDVGQTKTFTGSNGVFEIPVTFEQGGKTTIKLDISKCLS